MSKKLPMSLCIFVKNEENNIVDCIESVFPIVSEVVVVDTGSEDNTIELCKKYTDRIYSVGFTDFGSIRTITAHLSNRPWVLMLDADERILEEDWDKFVSLIDQPEGVKGNNMELDKEGNVIIDSWALPRKRWADKWMTRQVDVDSYPDWQVRLFRNHLHSKKIKFVRRVHEQVRNCIRTEKVDAGPTIHHFQNVNKDKNSLIRRKQLYESLYSLDIIDGVEHTEPPVIDIDK